MFLDDWIFIIYNLYVSRWLDLYNSYVFGWALVSADRSIIRNNGHRVTFISQWFWRKIIRYRSGGGNEKWCGIGWNQCRHELHQIRLFNSHTSESIKNQAMGSQLILLQWTPYYPIYTCTLVMAESWPSEFLYTLGELYPREDCLGEDLGEGPFCSYVPYVI